MTTETPPTISPLVADIITAGLAMTHDTTQRLIDSLTETVTDREATLGAIRAGVMDLLDGDHMPTPAAIQRALYPNDAYVRAFRRGGAS